MTNAILEERRIVIQNNGNPLLQWYTNHHGRYITRWLHYLDIYHRHFARFRGASPVVLEIGVLLGGSLDMWNSYFGQGCKLFAVDINPLCKRFENENTKIFIGDQADAAFLTNLRDNLPRIDILIDDGGHWANQQINTFKELFPHISDTGLYLCEDLHTSYIKEYDGAYQKAGTFVEYSKSLIDQLMAWHSQEPDRFKVDDFTRSTYAMHYYNGVLLIEKGQVPLPMKIHGGDPNYDGW